MRTLYWFTYFWVYLFTLMPKLHKAKKYVQNGQIQKKDELIEIEVGKWARKLLKAAGAEIEVEGMENIPSTPCVFVSNHQGNFDIPILLGYLNKPIGIVAKVELEKLPIIRTWMKYLNCVFIDRNNARNSMDGMKKSIENVKNGYSMAIFPEGTRSKGNPIAEFKSGAFMVATKTNAPIVPIRIEGSYKLMEANGNRIKPAKVLLKILPPVETENLTRQETKQLPEKLKHIIETAI